METERILVAAAAAAALLVVAGSMNGGDQLSAVSYDGRALLINGTRRVLFSGSIHYPRSTPDMWPYLIAKAKAGGLDVIQTYVFWNIHEPIQGQYNFQDRYDLIRFIKEIRDQGLFVSLRIGPFIEAEWKYGGFPFWLHDIPGIVYRSDNDPFKMHMQRFVSKIARMMKDEKLYASQGGPIILSQIENEYQTVEHAFHEKGTAYVNWAGKMAVSLQTGVPWIMCKQQDAPDPVINTCNGMRCGETFAGPNSPNKPSLWTENWTSFYQVYGEEPFVRSAEEIAFAVALFVAKKNGSFVNYYMYHGGTNFGNAASSYVITAYYDQAPLDEYGLVWQPKWAHLKELHEAIKANSEPLLMGKYTNLSFGPAQVAHIFQKDTGKCVAFLINEDSVRNAVVQFQNATYELPYMSISVLSDCKKVSFNTAMVSAQYGTRSTEVVEYFNQTSRWKLTMEKIPTSSYCTWVESGLIEQMAATKDSTDYLWYIIRYNITSINESNRLYINSLAHAVHVFINNEYIGTVHGSHGSRDAVIFNKSISLNIGQNEISLLSVMVGLPNSGAYLERRVAGLRRVRILSSENQLNDLSNNQWVYQVGLSGENLQIFTEQGAKLADWNTVENFPLQPLLWYMTRFDAPLGDDPLALNLSSMGKGEVWINGQSIGRYWVSFKTSKGVSSQSLYHVPRCFLKPSGNLLIIFEEEMGGNPSKITFETVSVSAICAMASEFYPKPTVKLQCPKGRAVSSILFASYGTPVGNCASYSVGSCHSESSITVAEKACLNRTGCSIPVSPSKFGEDPCPETSKSLLIAANCHRIARYVYRNKKHPPNSDILV